jgi:hypothetical protein
MVTASSGNIAAALPALAGAWARIDFSNSSDFSGAASRLAGPPDRRRLQGHAGSMLRPHRSNRRCRT